MNPSNGINKIIKLTGFLCAGLVGLLAVASLTVNGLLANLLAMGVAVDSSTTGAEVNLLYGVSLLVCLMTSLGVASFYIQGTWEDARKVATGGKASRWPRYIAFALMFVLALALGHQLPRIALGGSNLGQLAILYPLESFTLKPVGGLLLGALIYVISLIVAAGIVTLWVQLARRRRRQRFQLALDH